jgi:hypothetical protein
MWAKKCSRSGLLARCLTFAQVLQFAQKLRELQTSDMSTAVVYDFYEPGDVMALNQTVAVCIFFLWLKTFILVMTSINPMNHPAEDNAMMDADKKKMLAMTDQDKATFKRKQRMAENSLENHPMDGMILLMNAALVLSTNGMHDLSGAAEGAASLIAFYTAARFFYTLCYAMGFNPSKFPVRTIIFLLSKLMVLLAANMAIVVAFRAEYPSNTTP